MTQKPQSLFQGLVQRVASSRMGAWYFSRTLPYFDRTVLRLTQNRTSITSIFTGLPVVTVTCTGAKTGLARTVPLLAIQDETAPDEIALIASNWGQKRHPAWYYNLKANPQATCTLSGQSGMYMAHEAHEAEYEKYWQLAAETYRGYPLYKKRAGSRQIPILVMTPTEPA